jgi:hypothetical protein
MRVPYIATIVAATRPRLQQSPGKPNQPVRHQKRQGSAFVAIDTMTERTTLLLCSVAILLADFRRHDEIGGNHG